jgi:hypothetical protein
MRKTAAAMAGLLTALVTAATAIPASASVISPAPLTRNVIAEGSSLAIARSAASQAAGTMITVASGDTLAGLSAAVLGSEADWPDLWYANRTAVTDPSLIVPGERLTLPAGPAPASFRARAIALTRPRPAHAATVALDAAPAAPAGPPPPAGTYSYAGLEQLWESAGGPAWAAPHAAEIAECESGGRVSAYNPSGASGLWQILGAVVPGNLFSPFVNALNAVSKFRASGDSFAQWVCT